LAGFSVKTYVVKASGLAASESKTNIMNRVSGAIEQIYVTEGRTVQAGDPLLTIDGFETRLQIARLQATAAFAQGKIDLIDRLIIFVNAYTLSLPDTQANPFDNTLTAEAKYYSDAQTFIDYISGQAGAAEAEEPPREYLQSEVDSLKSQFLSQQYTEYDQYAAQGIENRSQIEMYSAQLEQYTVRAAQSGVVHLTAGIGAGTVLQAGSLLGSISSAAAGELYFETVISAADRSKIKIGDRVEIAAAGVLQAEFGILRGSVAAIDNDSTQTENGEVFFRIKIKPDVTRLTDKKGNEVSITTGMLAESRIKYDETTWLRWALEQVGVRF
jgi:multidrug efflux pump subunit AcrA (membrane-fusion protein)